MASTTSELRASVCLSSGFSVPIHTLGKGALTSLALMSLPGSEKWRECTQESQLCPHAPALCPQEPAFGMLTLPLRTPLTRLPVECHAEAVSVFKLVRVRPCHL